jgi:hypothetical protein
MAFLSSISSSGTLNYNALIHISKPDDLSQTPHGSSYKETLGTLATLLTKNIGNSDLILTANRYVTLDYNLHFDGANSIKIGDNLAPLAKLHVQGGSVGDIFKVSALANATAFKIDNVGKVLMQANNTATLDLQTLSAVSVFRVNTSNQTVQINNSVSNEYLSIKNDYYIDGQATMRLYSDSTSRSTVFKVSQGATGNFISLGSLGSADIGTSYHSTYKGGNIIEQQGYTAIGGNNSSIYFTSNFSNDIAQSSLFISGSTKQIGIGTTSVPSGAILDITSTTGAVIVPRMTATQASAITANNGAILYVTNTNATFLAVGFWGYENSVWVKL